MQRDSPLLQSDVIYVIGVRVQGRSHHYYIRWMAVSKFLDRALKAFFDEALRMFLHIMEAVPLDQAVELTPLPRETAPPVVMPDTAVRVTQAHLLQCQIVNRSLFES